MNAYLAAPLGFLALGLSGCGGGGDSGSPTPPPTPAGPTTTTTTTTVLADCPGDCAEVKVLSYNLEWHKTQGGDDIVKTIQANGQFDLMGFQECDNIQVFLNKVGPNYAFKQEDQDQHEIALAWDTTKFTKVSEGDAIVGKDGWANRHMQWVRLQMVGTNKHVFFANTHGPVNQCKGKYEDWKGVSGNYVKNIKDNMQDGDSLFFTGDFNCGTPDDLMGVLRENFYDHAQASWFKPILYQPDHIFTLQQDAFAADWSAVCCAQPGNCKPVTMTGPNTSTACVAYPSDHMLLHGTFKIPKGKADVVV